MKSALETLREKIEKNYQEGKSAIAYLEANPQLIDALISERRSETNIPKKEVKPIKEVSDNKDKSDNKSVTILAAIDTVPSGVTKAQIRDFYKKERGTDGETESQVTFGLSYLKKINKVKLIPKPKGMPGKGGLWVRA